MVKNADELFQKFVNHIKIADISYAKELHFAEDQELETVDGSLYVTIGDEEPWLVVYVDDKDFALALEPELAIYWLQKIAEYYKKNV